MMRVRSATGHGQTNLRALTHFAILPDGDILDKLFIHQACQRNVIEEPVDLAAEIIPQFVRQATPTLLAVPRTIAACGFNPFINGRDNLADHDPISSPAERIPATWTTGAADKVTSTKSCEQLFEIGQGNILS
jgi:hypothetical protein